MNSLRRGIDSLDVRLLLVFCSLLGPGVAVAQLNGFPGAGVPPFSSTAGGQYDTINLSNLSITIEVPIRSKATGAFPVSYTMTLNPMTYKNIVPGVAVNWIPVTGFSTTLSSPDIDPTRVIRWTKEPQTRCSNGLLYNIYDKFYWIDAAGTRHDFPHIRFDTVNCLPSTLSDTAGDQSGYQLVLTSTNPINFILYDRSGDWTSGNNILNDPNSNKLSYSTSTGAWTDPLAQTVLTYNTNGASYTDAAGGSVPVSQSVYTTYTNGQTNYGCTNPAVSESQFSPNNLAQSITLPNGTSFGFTYMQTPGFGSGYTDGRLSSMTLPTGGTIQYQYSGGSNGINCSDGSWATLKRVNPDGTFTTFTHTPPPYGSTSTISTTTVVDANGNETDYTFSGNFETQRLVYQGNGASKSLLRTVITCYNNNTSNGTCPTAAVTAPISQKTVYMWMGAYGALPSNTTSTSYDTYGNLTQTIEYDWWSGSAYPIVRTTNTTYGTYSNGQCVAISSYIHDRPCIISVQDGSSPANTLSYTVFQYDAYGNGTARGDWVGPAAGNYLWHYFSYNANGTIKTATDVNNAQTTYGYSGTGGCNSLLPTSVSEPLSLSQSLTWDCNGGVIKTRTDENSQVTTVSYIDSSNHADPYWRPLVITDRIGAQKTFNYSPAGNSNAVEVTQLFNITGASAMVDFLYWPDNLGRTAVVQKRRSGSSSVNDWDTVYYGYDAVGQKIHTSLPYQSTAVGAAAIDTTQASSTTQYDAIGRVLSYTDPSNTVVTTYQYPGNDVYASVVAPAGENSKRKQLEYDGIGRLASVCEITGASGSGSCGQTTARTGYWTKYSYGASSSAASILTVTQSAQSGSVQTRMFYRDGVGRLTSETNPENGTVSYFYDSPSADCPVSSPGDLIERKFASGSFACFYRDALHRAVDTGSGPPVCRRFRFDNTVAPPPGVSVTNNLGRLTEAFTDNCSTSTKITDEWFSYDATGRVTDVYQSTPNSGGYYHSTAQYFENGALKALSPGIGGASSLCHGPIQWMERAQCTGSEYDIQSGRSVD